MARIARVTQKIFAATATNNGVFGSAQANAGPGTISNVLATIMGLGAWSTGWLSAIIGGSKYPPLEEFQAVEYVHSTQIAYILSQGIPEYDAGTPYYANNIVINPGTYQLYGSITNNNEGNALSDTGNWELLLDLSAPVSDFSTGDMKPTWKTAADTGWILASDGTIGSAASGASYANANAANLYALWWNNITNTYAPVTGGRGGSAAADFAANKPIAMPLMLGRVMGASGSGSTLTPRTLGQNLGEETHTLTATEGPAHSHGITDGGHDHAFTAAEQSGSSLVGGTNNNTCVNMALTTSNATTGITINNNTPSGGAHNNMQPSSFCNWMIKL